MMQWHGRQLMMMIKGKIWKINDYVKHSLHMFNFYESFYLATNTADSINQQGRQNN